MAKKLTDEQKKLNKILRKSKKHLSETSDDILKIKLKHIISLIEKDISVDAYVLKEMLKGALEFKGDFK